MPLTDQGVSQALENAIPIVLNRSLMKMYPSLDPFFKACVSSEGVVSSGWGQDWHIKKVIYSGLAGVVEMSPTFSVMGDAVGEVDNMFYLNNQTLGTYPDPRESATPEPYQMTINLNGLRATLDLTFAEMRLDQMDSKIGEIWSQKIEGFARQIAMFRINHFYSTDSNGAICTAPTTGGDYADANGSNKTTVTFNPGNKAINRFVRGMQIDFHTDDATGSGEGASGNGRLNETSGGVRYNFIVRSVNHLRNKVVAVCEQASLSVDLHGMASANSVTHTEGSDNLVVHLRNSQGDRFNGLNTFMRDLDAPSTLDPGGTLLGIDLAKYPEHQSLILDNGGAVLTEDQAAQAISKFTSAKRPWGMTVDTAVTTPGVFNAYVASRIARERVERGGNLRSATSQGTSGGFKVTWNGVTLDIELSDWCNQGEMYALKKADNNWKRYVPPRTPGAGNFPGGGSDMEDLFMEFEFVGPLAGYPGLRVPFIQSSLTTQLTSLPGDSRMELVPDQFAGIRWVGLAEAEITPAS